MAANPGVLEFSFQYTLDGKRYSNQLHYVQAPSDPAPVTLSGYASQHVAAVAALWNDNVVSLQSNLCITDKIVLTYFGAAVKLPTIPPAPVGTPQKLYFAVVEQQEWTAAPLTFTGAVEDESLPAFNTFRAMKTSGQAGRRKRGHIGVAGIPESLSSGNVLQSGAFTAWNSQSLTLLTSNYTVTDDLFTYVMQPRILSVTAMRAFNLEGVNPVDFSYLVTGRRANELIGTMRRRKKKTV